MDPLGKGTPFGLGLKAATTGSLFLRAGSRKSIIRSRPVVSDRCLRSSPEGQIALIASYK